jgi:hypothetical protein
VPPVEGPGLADQVNLTDAESRIMPVPGGGFEQCYNAQAVDHPNAIHGLRFSVSVSFSGLRRALSRRPRRLPTN